MRQPVGALAHHASCRVQRVAANGLMRELNRDGYIVPENLTTAEKVAKDIIAAKKAVGGKRYALNAAKKSCLRASSN